MEGSGQRMLVGVTCALGTPFAFAAEGPPIPPELHPWAYRGTAQVFFLGKGPGQPACPLMGRALAGIPVDLVIVPQGSGRMGKP